jgi:hypothetical protein
MLREVAAFDADGVPIRVLADDAGTVTVLGEPRKTDAAVRAVADAMVGMGPVTIQAVGTWCCKHFGISKGNLTKELLEAHKRRPVTSQVERSDGPIRGEPEAWGEPVDGKALLEAILAEGRQLVRVSEEGLLASVLHAIYTHAIDSWPVAPKLGIVAGVAEAGKSTLARFHRSIAGKSWTCIDPSPASLFRTIHASGPLTVYLDEFDAKLAEMPEQLRALLNAGFGREEAWVSRVNKETGETEHFNVFGPVVWSGIASPAQVPGTIASRSILIAMARLKEGERVVPWRGMDRVRAARLEQFRRKVARWVADHRHRLAAADPAMPAELGPRACDVWHALLAVADRLGPEIADRARAAAVLLSGKRARTASSLVIELLMDVRAAVCRPRPTDAELQTMSSPFNIIPGPLAAWGLRVDDKGQPTDPTQQDWRALIEDLPPTRHGPAVPSAHLAEALRAMPDRAWGERGKELSEMKLAKLLQSLVLGTGEGIKPRTMKIKAAAQEWVLRSYRLRDLADLFDRYLADIADDRGDVIDESDAADESKDKL